MRILALDSALARCVAGVVAAGVVVAARCGQGGSGQAARLPAMAAGALEDAGLPPASLDLVAVTVGPGSFTGIRAALALAHGIALGAGIPVVGVTVGEALLASLPFLGERSFWSAVDSRRGRVFLERGESVMAFGLDALPPPSGPVAVGGDAAAVVAARLAARGVDVMLTDARAPHPRWVAATAEARHAGALPPRPALPLYVDPPEAVAPAGGLRPPPGAR